jgi:nitroreductase
MRRLKPDPVPDALITEILEAATCAPNGGNSQKWRFLVVKDPAVKKPVQHYYERAYDEVQKPRHNAHAPKELGPALNQHHRNEASIKYLTDHFHETRSGSSPTLRMQIQTPPPPAPWCFPP